MCCDVMATGDCSLLDRQSTSLSSSSSPTGGLGYSRHYAQRIRDLGQSSKDTWIHRLWNHMFGPANSGGNKKVSAKTEEASCSSRGSRRCDDHVDDGSSPLDSCSRGQFAETNDTRRTRAVSSCDKHEVPVAVGHRQTRSTQELTGRAMPAQLVNSPYLPPKDKVIYYRPMLNAKPGSSKHDGITAAKLRFQRLSKSSSSLRPSLGHSVNAPDDLHKHSSVCHVKRPYKRDSAVIQMEKRAKAAADRAIVVCMNLFCGLHAS